MRARSSMLVVGVITALISSAAHAEGVDVQSQLVEQGQYWQARGNAQRAGEVWQKVLLLDKRQINALYGMGLIGVKLDKPLQANEYLARLQALSPVPWQARQLMQDIALAKPENQALLVEARRLADAGQRDEATEVFRKIFNGLTPEGTIGREYYNNLAFNDAGWREARKGMERLLRETPDDSILALFYGKQLARHEESRAEGARVLARLTKHVDIAGDADESWRLDLLWMGPPTAAQVPLFDAFLKAHPDDQQIREQLNKGRKRMLSGQQDTLVGRGLQAVQKGDLAEAEKAFQEWLALHPDDIDAMGGLGLIRQQQNRLADAEQLLDRAVGKGGSQWQSALRSVRYWLLIQRGRELQAKGQGAQAQGALAQALRLDPKNIDGRLAMADIRAEAGQFDAAAAAYREVLAMRPGNPPAVRGLVGVLSQTGQADQALRLLDSLSPEEQARFGDHQRLRSLRAAQLASLAEQRGDMASAQNAMRDAVSNDPDNVWTSFSLARLYLKSGERQKARDTVNAFIGTHPDDADALYASALLSVEMAQWADAQAAINRIPANRRKAVMNDLADQITLAMQVNQALALIKTGQHQDALALLDKLQPMAEGNPERIGTLASAYADAGDAQRALAMMQPLVGAGSAPPADLLLQYAAILLRTGDDAQVYAILTGLQSQPLDKLNRKRYDDLRFQYRLRQADRLREGGDLASAYDTLAPALMQRPDDASAISILARMYIANGESAKARDLYKPLMQHNPLDAGVLLGAADAAVLARDNVFAESALGQFVKLQSIDPASLTEAARIYRLLGKVDEASVLLRQAVDIEARQKQRTLASPSGTINLAVNPFRNQRRQAVLDAASAIPPPLQNVLKRDAVAGAVDMLPGPADTPRRVPAVASIYPNAASAPTAYPAASSAYAVSLPVASGAGSSTARWEPPMLQADPQAVLAAADAASPAQRALNDILQARSPYITQGVLVRSNASEGGLSQLTDVEAPLEVNMPVGDKRVAVRITPVSLNAGGMTDEAASRFGGGAAGATGVGSQRANGVGVGASYERSDGGLKADIGTTPMGFRYVDAVAGVSIEQALADSANARYGVSLSRRAVTDSLTSFAGTTDHRNDSSWGGVTANGGRVQLSYDDSLAGVYSYGSVHALTGHNVASNTRVELGAGAYRYLDNQADNKLTAGVSATVLSYANNQNFFTYGNGGYFSPQAYVALGVPVTWAQRTDNFSFQVKAALGVQYFQQDSADYFPTDSTLQAASGLHYAKQSKTGLGYSLEGAGEYRLGPRLFVGGALRLNNSSDFKEVNAGIYVRYTFEDMKGRFMTLPVSPYRSPYSN